MVKKSLLKMHGITKHFPGVLALSDVSFDLFSGEVHCLVGENGAGKSTLIKIISGACKKDKGDIFIEGKKVEFESPRQAQELGVATVYQELNLVPYMTVEENIFLGHEFVKNRLGQIDWMEVRNRAKEILSQMKVKIPPQAKVSSLSLAEQQIVEIVKALSMGGKIIIMDEPTAALTDKETYELFETIRNLKERGAGVIYISHRLEELFDIADRITILRDGKNVATFEDVSKISLDEIITLMIGQQPKDRIPKLTRQKGKELLKVQDFNSRRGDFKDVNFFLCEGEILGFAGLRGSGRKELMRAIFGVDPVISGIVYLNGCPVKIKSPVDAVRYGIGLLTEDRKSQGLILELPIATNITLSKLSRISSVFRIDKSKEIKFVNEFVEELKIKTPNIFQLVKFLSGGNQQKVVLAKWLFTQSRILIFDEPTRGIDVGTKAEIYQLIKKLASMGVGIIVVSSEMPEIIGLSDRIIVMHNGFIVSELSGAEADQESILRLAMGNSNKKE